MRRHLITITTVCWLAFGLSAPLHAAEMKLFNGERITVLVEGFNPQDGKLTVYLTSGEKKAVELRQVAAIYFSGRPDHFIRTGDQKFIFNAGGHLCAAAEKLNLGEMFELRNQSLGRHIVPINVLHGFSAMAIEGRTARMADDLMREDADNRAGLFLDQVLDRRGVPYAGVVEKFDPLQFEFEHDEQLQRVRLDTHKVAGVRLAEAAKQPTKDPGLDAVRAGVRCRDRSYVVGRIVAIDPFLWKIQPDFDPAREIAISASEITEVNIIGGRAVFLSQIDPIKTEEKTIIAPPQPFQKNTNVQGENMDIGGFIYHNGIGVHAKSSLTYRLDGKFETFKADVGIDGRLEKEGSVVFSVTGDGKELFKSPVVRGKISGGGLAVEVPVAGVKELTLMVDPTADLDQADLANWGAARLLR